MISSFHRHKGQGVTKSINVDLICEMVEILLCMEYVLAVYVKDVLVHISITNVPGSGLIIVNKSSMRMQNWALNVSAIPDQIWA